MDANASANENEKTAVDADAACVTADYVAPIAAQPLTPTDAAAAADAAGEAAHEVNSVTPKLMGAVANSVTPTLMGAVPNANWKTPPKYYDVNLNVDEVPGLAKEKDGANADAGVE